MGMLEREGKVKPRVIGDRKKPALHAVLDDMVDKGSLVNTDEHPGYLGIERLSAQDREPLGDLRGWRSSHAGNRELLEPVETWAEGDVHRG